MLLVKNSARIKVTSFSKNEINKHHHHSHVVIDTETDETDGFKVTSLMKIKTIIDVRTDETSLAVKFEAISLSKAESDEHHFNINANLMIDKTDKIVKSEVITMKNMFRSSLSLQFLLICYK